MTCWQQRVDPESEANVGKRRKQRPVSIAGDADSIGLKQSLLKRTSSTGSLVIHEDGVMWCHLSTPPYLPAKRVTVQCIKLQHFPLLI